MVSVLFILKVRYQFIFLGRISDEMKQSLFLNRKKICAPEFVKYLAILFALSQVCVFSISYVVYLSSAVYKCASFVIQLDLIPIVAIRITFKQISSAAMKFNGIPKQVRQNISMKHLSKILSLNICVKLAIADTVKMFPKKKPF